MGGARVAVTAIGEGISYLSEDRLHVDLDGLCRRIFAALIPGGVFIFDVVETSSGAPMRYEASREGSDWSVHVRVDEDPTKRLLTR